MEKNNLNAGNKDKRRPIFIVLGVLAVLLIGGVAFAAFNGGMNSTIEVMGKKEAKAIVFEALSGNMGDQKQSAYQELLGTDFFNFSEQQSRETGFRFEVLGAEDIPELDALAGSEIFADIASDAKTNKSSGTFGIGTGGMNLFDAKFYADKNNLMVSLPQYSGKLFTVDLTNDLKDQIDNSYIANKMGIKGSTVTSLSSLMKEAQTLMNGGVLGLDVAEIIKRYEDTRAVKNFKSTMESHEIESKVFKVNGVDVECKGYEVKAAQPTVIKLFRDLRAEVLADNELKEELGKFLLQLYRFTNNYSDEELKKIEEQVWDDIDKKLPGIISDLEEHMRCMVLDVYIDGAGNVISIDGLTAYIVDDVMTSVTIEMDNHGGYTTNENMEVVVTISNDDYEGKLHYSTSGKSTSSLLDTAVQIGIEENGKNIMTVNVSGQYKESTGDYRIAFFCNDAESQLMYFSSNGKISNLVKGTKADLAIDSLVIAAEGNEILDLTGSFYFKPLTKKIETLEGDPFDLLNSTEKDWEELNDSISEKILPLLNSLESILN